MEEEKQPNDQAKVFATSITFLLRLFRSHISPNMQMTS